MHKNVERFILFDMSKEWHQASKNRAAARARGENKYHSPKPCPKGHIGLRYTRCGGCVECSLIYSRSRKKKEYDKLRYEDIATSKINNAKNNYSKNKEQRKKRIKKWQSANKEKVRAYKLANKAQRKMAEVSGDSPKMVSKWISKQEKTCYWCGCCCKNNYHIDHYIPLAKGGKHTLANLVISCPPCNTSKGAKDPLEFAKYIGKKGEYERYQEIVRKSD